MARWRNGRLFPDPLAVHDFVVVAPDYIDEPLVGTAVEAADLVSRFGARAVDGDYDPVAAMLRSEGIQLVHFAGHGTYDEDAPLQSRIRLSDQALLPTDVRTFRQGLARGPFVFLNACEVGEQGWVFTGIGGWADTFCDVGCAGFVGPYWAVDDEVARLAALRFYDGLAAGKPVGEAIRGVRRAFDEPGPFVHHPTWLAYSLHCQPNIRIDLKH
jgi:CHAT domain-containing protein